ncbi:hypothetical protein SAMD00019534_025310 [Acytostelium subglobosum LB1]|uniref:hypothetical protein n=1 Tax=Acytostelium subglobosum LB1 TaxID=1410327 RepID=UPI000644A78E|nr:hypothetical protein SAMD00019534_025310 [Acytostelium subglobosum LB1]GAM19356.1 hypothetical protein SAMD00019534_025310 [Acytostelium subglobosum LB1]|eukprot:XP_012757283.1 hypothetical protein SAMD00019534_025310 [Acytostelium subglobosum LB1]
MLGNALTLLPSNVKVEFKPNHQNDINSRSTRYGYMSYIRQSKEGGEEDMSDAWEEAGHYQPYAFETSSGLPMGTQPPAMYYNTYSSGPGKMGGGGFQQPMSQNIYGAGAPISPYPPGGVPVPHQYASGGVASTQAGGPSYPRKLCRFAERCRNGDNCPYYHPKPSDNYYNNAAAAAVVGVGKHDPTGQGATHVYPSSASMLPAHYQQAYPSYPQQYHQAQPYYVYPRGMYVDQQVPSHPSGGSHQPMAAPPQPLSQQRSQEMSNHHQQHQQHSQESYISMTPEQLIHSSSIPSPSSSTSSLSHSSQSPRESSPQTVNHTQQQQHHHHHVNGHQHQQQQQHNTRNSNNMASHGKHGNNNNNNNKQQQQQQHSHTSDGHNDKQLETSMAAAIKQLHFKGDDTNNNNNNDNVVDQSSSTSDIQSPSNSIPTPVSSQQSQQQQHRRGQYQQNSTSPSSSPSSSFDKKSSKSPKGHPRVPQTSGDLPVYKGGIGVAGVKPFGGGGGGGGGSGGSGKGSKKESNNNNNSNNNNSNNNNYQQHKKNNFPPLVSKHHGGQHTPIVPAVVAEQLNDQVV